MFGQLPADVGAVFADDAGEIAVGDTEEDNELAHWSVVAFKYHTETAYIYFPGTHYMFRPTHLRNYNMNFGHLFVDDILSTYIAMQVALPPISL